MAEDQTAEWVPAFEGQRPPFAPGNTLHLSHGAYSPRKVEPLARGFVEALLEDATVPAYAKAPAYRAELWATARAEAQVQLLTEFLMTAGEQSEDGLGDLGDERIRAAYLLLHRAEGRAASGRTGATSRSRCRRRRRCGRRRRRGPSTATRRPSRC